MPYHNQTSPVSVYLRERCQGPVTFYYTSTIYVALYLISFTTALHLSYIKMSVYLCYNSKLNEPLAVVGGIDAFKIRKVLYIFRSRLHLYPV